MNAPVDVYFALLEDRMRKQCADGAFVVLTSWRGNRSPEDNQTTLTALKKQIRSAGFGFIQIEGVGQQNQGDALVEVSEPSLLVQAKTPGDDAGRSLLKQALDWARAPGGDHAAAQDHIFYADGAEKLGSICLENEVVDVSRVDLMPSSISQFYASLRSGGSFVCEWSRVRFRALPGSWAEGVGRESEGEIFQASLCVGEDPNSAGA